MRSLLLGGLALLAVLSMILAWRGIPDVAAGDAAAIADGIGPAPRADPTTELEDPDAVSPDKLSSDLETGGDQSFLGRSTATRIVDASERAAGVDLHGSVLVVGGERRNLPALTLVFRQGSVSEETQAIEGEYLMAGLPPGRWRVAAQAAGYKPLATEIEVLDRPRSQQLDFTLERLPQIFVTIVTRRGEPLMKALRSEESPLSRMSVVVVATPEPPRECLGATFEDTYARYGVGTWRPASGWKTESEADDPRAGVLELVRSMPVYVSACVESVVLATQFVPASAERVGFVISPDDLRAARGGLRFRILDAVSGAPITQGRVGLHASGQFGTGREIIQPDGTVEFRDEIPGPRDLSIVCRGYEWVAERIWIEGGRDTDLGVYRLDRPISIEGTAVDEAGSPVRAWVSVWPIERYEAAQQIADKFCWHADDEGRFRILPAGRRRYLLRANDEVWAGEAVVVDASRGPVENVRLRVARGVPLTVRFDPDTPRGARLSVHDMQGQPIAERAVDPGGATKIGLGPGRYRVRMDFDGIPRGERAIEMAGQPLAISLGP